jgi:hypothetical protein
MSENQNDPTGLLILAAPFVIGGILMLFQRGPSLVIASPARYSWSHQQVVASE